MWEAISNIFTSEKADEAFHFLSMVVAVSIVVLIFLFLLGRKGFVKVHTKHIHIGNELTQRELIRRQVETAHTFIMSLYGKIATDESQYQGYFTKYILERVYDKVIEWIIFNHISTNQLYVSDKQEAICNLVYMMNIKDEFKTPEFKQRINNWVKELIEQLVKVKEIYQ